jgi:hypothetical protein
MNIPPLQLGSCQFTEISIDAQQSAKDEDRNRYDWQVTANAFPREVGKVREWAVFVNVELKPVEGSAPPYLGKVSAFGLFTVVDSWKEEDIEKLVFINGGGIVYASIRELVSLITGRFVWGSLMLPGYSFAQLYTEWKEAEEAEKKQPELKIQTNVPSPQNPSPLTAL